MRLLQLLFFTALLCQSARTHAQELSLGVYGQTTNQHETHLMPQVSIRTPRDMALRAEASYLVDVSSRASIELRDGMSRELKQTQHELSTRLGYDWRARQIALHYRYVDRPNYVSHTIDAPLALGWDDWAQRVSVQPYIRFNRLGRGGDPAFERSSKMFGLRGGFQPWLNARTLGQISYELQYASGYLSDPHRFAGLGSRIGCTSATPYCVPDHNPDTRLQHAVVISARRALSETVSMGLLYRFFIDDWSMASHTLEPDLAWLAWQDGLLRVRYRAYLQSATAAFHAAQADVSRTVPSDVTEDERYTQMQTHRVSLDAEQTWRPAASLALTTLLTIGALRVAYADDYYRDVTALEATLWVGLRM